MFTQVFNKRLIVYFSSIISICLCTVNEEAVIGLTAHKLFLMGVSLTYTALIYIHFFKEYSWSIKQELSVYINDNIRSIFLT